MPSSGAAEQSRKEPLSSAVHLSALSAVLVHHCNSLRFVLRPPSPPSDGVSQNKERAPCLGRNSSLCRRGDLLPTAQDAVRRQRTQLLVFGNESLLSKRTSFFLSEKAPPFAIKQVHTVYSCEWDFIVSPSPAATSYRRKTLLQKRAVRRERRDVATVHLRCTSCGACARFAYSGASSFPRFSCWPSSLLVREPFVFTLPRAGCLALCSRLVAWFHTRKERSIGHFPVDVNVYSRTYTQVKTRDEGEPTCPSTVACSVRSPELLRVATARLLGIKYLFVASLLLLFMYALMRRGEDKCFSSFVGSRRPLAPSHSSVIASVDGLSVGGVQHAVPIVVSVGGFMVGVIVLLLQTYSCSRHSAAAEALGDLRMREIVQKPGKTAPCGLPAFLSVMFVQAQNKGNIYWKRSQVTFTCLLFLSAVPTVVLDLPYPLTWALVLRLRGLHTAGASSSSSSAFTSHSSYVWASSFCSRNGITYTLEPSFLSAGVASSIWRMVLPLETTPPPLSDSRSAFLFLLNFVRTRRTCGTRKEHVEQTAAALSKISTTACIRRAVTLLSMILLGFLSSCAAQSQQFSSRCHHLLSSVVFSVSPLFRRSRTSLLNLRPCHSSEAAAVFADAWIDTHQRTATRQKQWLRQTPLHYARQLINVTKWERSRWTAPHSPYREAVAYLYIPAKKQVLSVSAAARADGRRLKKGRAAGRRGGFQRKIPYIQTAASQDRSHCYVDGGSLRFQKQREDNKKEGHCSAPCCDKSFQTPKKDLSFQLYSLICLVGVPLTILQSTSASSAMSASTFLLGLSLGASWIAAACFFLVMCLFHYLVCLAQASSPFRYPHHLGGGLCASAFHWIFVLPTFSISFSLRHLWPVAFAAEPDTFVPLSGLLAPVSIISGYLPRGIFYVEPRRGRGQLNYLNSICLFPSCSPVSDNIASASSPLLLSSWGLTISPSLLHSCTGVYISAFGPFVTSFCSLRCFLVTFSRFALVPRMKRSVFVLLLPSVLSTAVAFVPCCCCSCSRPAGVCLLPSQVLSAASFVIHPAGSNTRVTLISPKLAVMPCLSQPSGISATGLAAAAPGSVPAALAAGRICGDVAGWSTVLAEYRGGAIRTREAVRSSFAAACRCGNFVSVAVAAAAAGSTETAGRRKAGSPAFLVCSISHDVSFAKRIYSRWSPPSPSVAASAAQGGETRPVIYFHSQSRGRILSLLSGRLSTAADRVPLLLTAVLNVILLYSWSHFPTSHPYFHRGLFRSCPWWPSLSVRWRPRCCNSFVCSPALLLLLLLLLSWILSSAEFTVVSDVDENIFLDLTGGLPEKQDSLLVRMSAGRRFSILNLDKQKFEIMPGSFRSEAFQILFETVADRRSLTNPLACDRSLPRMRYTAYFIFSSPLADFWEQLPTPSTSDSPRVTHGVSPSSASGIYRFTWPRGYQAVSLGTGLCIQVVQKQINAKHILNVMFLTSSASPSSQQISAIRKVSLWIAVSLAVALLPLI